MSPRLAKILYSFRIISKLDSLPQSAIYVMIIYLVSSIFYDYHPASFYANLTEGLVTFSHCRIAL